MIKQVEVPMVQTIEKTVEIPQVQTVEKTIEIPQVMQVPGETRQVAIPAAGGRQQAPAEVVQVTEMGAPLPAEMMAPQVMTAPPPPPVQTAVMAAPPVQTVQAVQAA